MYNTNEAIPSSANRITAYPLYDVPIIYAVSLLLRVVHCPPNPPLP